MLRMKIQIVARKRLGRRQATVTNKLILRGEGPVARLMRKLRAFKTKRRLVWQA